MKMMAPTAAALLTLQLQSVAAQFFNQGFLPGQQGGMFQGGAATQFPGQQGGMFPGQQGGMFPQQGMFPGAQQPGGQTGGAGCTCPDGSTPNFGTFPPCQGGPPQGADCQGPGGGGQMGGMFPGQQGGTATQFPGQQGGMFPGQQGGTATQFPGQQGGMFPGQQGGMFPGQQGMFPGAQQPGGQTGGAGCTCPDGSTPNFGTFPPCQGGPPQGADCQPPPGGAGGATGGMAGGPGGGGGPGAGGPGGGGPGGGAATDFSGPGPYPASLLGNVGRTTVAGTTANEFTGAAVTLPVGTDIFGPFEAGFSAQQNFVLERLGCSDGNLGHVAGGLDTHTAEQMVAFQCGITLPRYENGRRISLLDECGGHTQYHFHERLKCLYSEAGAHSTKVGEANDGKPIYGRWENFATGEEPMLDACGGHWGYTPDSPTVKIYHYHVQVKPPFTVGCFGPNPDDSLVTLQQCRALYPGCGDNDVTTVNTAQGSKSYDPWCPCYDASGSNTGNLPLPVFSNLKPLPSATTPAIDLFTPIAPTTTTTTTTTSTNTRPDATAPCPVQSKQSLRGVGGVEVTSNGRSVYVAAVGEAFTCSLDAAVSVEFRAATMTKPNAAAIRTGGSTVGLTSWPAEVVTSTGNTYEIRAVPQNSCTVIGCSTNTWASQGNSAVLQNIAPGGQKCYCDDACTRFKDCCVDYQHVCKSFKY